MGTVATPVSIRDHALAVISATLGRQATLQDGLEEIGVADLVHLLIALETGFGVDLDADEAIAARTVGGLIDLLEPRADGRRVISWDDERARRALPLAPRPPPLRLVEAVAVDDDGFDPNEPSMTLGVDSLDIADLPLPLISDDAWAKAQAGFMRERRVRLGLGAVGVLCLAGMLVGASWWLRLSGVLS